MTPSLASTLALVLGALIFLYRARRAVRTWRAAGGVGARFQPAWVASGFAIIGLLTLGLVWLPADEMDGALPLVGGQNFLNLVEALAATAGFWYLRDAVRLYSGDRRPARRRHLVLHCLVFSAFFVAVPRREGDAVRFIDEHLASTACWVYISLYMLGVLYLALDSLRSAWKRRADLPGKAFVLGFASVAVGAVFDLAYTSLGHVRGELTPTGSALLTAFEAFFFPGMVVIMTGYLLPALGRSFWRAVGWRLSRMSEAGTSRELLRRWTDESDPLGEAYATSIRIQGRVLDDTLRLGARDPALDVPEPAGVARAAIPAGGRTWRA